VRKLRFVLETSSNRTLFHGIFRGSSYTGLSQDVHVVAGERYNFTAYIKLLNLPSGASYEPVQLLMICMNAKGTQTVYVNPTYHSAVLVSDLKFPVHLCVSTLVCVFGYLYLRKHINTNGTFGFGCACVYVFRCILLI